MLILKHFLFSRTHKMGNNFGNLDFEVGDFPNFDILFFREQIRFGLANNPNGPMRAL